MHYIMSFYYMNDHMNHMNGLFTIIVLIPVVVADVDVFVVVLSFLQLVQVRLRTEVLRTPSSTRLGFKLMTTKSCI